MARGYLQARIESTPGNETNTPTLSTKVMYLPVISAEPTLNPSHLLRDDEIRNLDEPVIALEDSHAPSWTVTVRGYPDVIGYVLWWLFGAPTTTAGNGVITDPDTTTIPAGAFRHVWTAPFGPAGVSPLTSQLIFAYADQGVFFTMKGSALTSLSIETPESGGMQLSFSGPALFMSRGADPVLTPAYESLAIRPFTRSNLTLPTWLSGTGTTEDFSLAVESGAEVVRSLGIASRFPDIMEKSGDPIAVTGSIPKRVIDAQDYDALKAATGFTATARWVSESIVASSYPYKLFVQMDNAQYMEGGPAALVNQRRIGATFNWRASTDGTGASTTWTLVNATAAYT